METHERISAKGGYAGEAECHVDSKKNTAGRQYDEEAALQA